MRWKAIILAILPLTNALSLANFQDITSVLIPLSCQISYDSQIPSCTVADFQAAGCSAACIKSLTAVGKSVSQACSDVTAESDTLLGIVKNGGILKALCSTPQSTATTSVKPSATTSQQTSLHTSSSRIVISISPSITTTPHTTITTSSLMTSTVQSTSETTSSSTETLDTATTPPTSTSQDLPTRSQNEASATKTSAASTTTKAPQSDSGGGGGSPFDISSRGEKRFEKRSMLAFIIAAWAGLLLRG